MTTLPELRRCAAAFRPELAAGAAERELTRAQPCAMTAEGLRTFRAVA
ncbi:MULTISPECIES: hypothetical protein [unclassified Nonomuraea]